MEVRQPQSDVAALWEEALTSYSEVAKVDIRSILQSQQSISSIMVSNSVLLDEELPSIFQHKMMSCAEHRHLDGTTTPT